MSTAPETARTTAAAEPIGARALRGAIGGAVAGIPFALVTMWFAASMGDAWTAPLSMIASLALGTEVLGSAHAGVLTVGVIVHTVISMVAGVVFALLAPAFRTNGAAALAGTLFGLGLYIVNFVVIANVAFPQFLMANQPFELVVHVLFGVLLSFFFYSTGVRRNEGVLGFRRK